MFSFLKHTTNTDINNAKTTTVKLKLTGMHCVACSITIDDTLEELPGVTKSATNYAKSLATVTYDPSIIDLTKIQNTITNLGYSIASNDDSKGL